MLSKHKDLAIVMLIGNDICGAIEIHTATKCQSSHKKTVPHYIYFYNNLVTIKANSIIYMLAPNWGFQINSVISLVTWQLNYTDKIPSYQIFHVGQR